MSFIRWNFRSMNKLSSTFLMIFLCFSACGLSAQTEASALEQELSSIMNEQANSWNSGDIEAFMQAYWQSDSLLFIGGSGPQYGWQNTLERYLTAYPSREAMGELSFETFNIELLSDSAAMLSGRWTLVREQGDLGGYYSLLWKKIAGEWIIVYDHTSSVKIK